MSIRDIKEVAEKEVESTLEELWRQGLEVFRVHITRQEGSAPIVSIIFDDGRGQS